MARPHVTGVSDLTPLGQAPNVLPMDTNTATATAATDRRIESITYEMTPCDRCGSTGRMPFAAYGGTCFKCNGKGETMTSKGRAAWKRVQEVKAEHLTIPVADVKVGDRVRGLGVITEVTVHRLHHPQHRQARRRHDVPDRPRLDPHRRARMDAGHPQDRRRPRRPPVRRDRQLRRRVTAAPMPAHAFVGGPCRAIETGPDCTAVADFLVVDGSVWVPTCARHLLDTIEREVAEQGLTVDCDPLEVLRLRHAEDD